MTPPGACHVPRLGAAAGQLRGVRDDGDGGEEAADLQQRQLHLLQVHPQHLAHVHHVQAPEGVERRDEGGQVEGVQPLGGGRADGTVGLHRRQRGLRRVGQVRHLRPQRFRKVETSNGGRRVPIVMRRRRAGEAEQTWLRKGQRGSV
eukprot:1183032-Prorocentrum_minimum.AAC.1